MNRHLPVASLLCAMVLAFLAGCAGYNWKPSVPEAMRTVSVPVFVNESGVTGLGSEITRQTLREFEREGTMRIRRTGQSAIEVQGVVKSSLSRIVAYERKTGSRNREHEFKVVAEVSVIDKRAGTVLIDNRRYTARTAFFGHDDKLTGEREASGRIAEDLARQIVDDVLAMKWDSPTADSAEAGKDK